METLGLILSKLGRKEEAEETLESIVRYRREANEPPDQMGFILYNLGSVYSDHGKHEQALPMISEAVSVMSEAVGKDHPTTAHMESFLAGVHLALGRPREAIPLLDHACEVREKTFGPTHSSVGTTRRKRGRASMLLGDFESAEKDLEFALQYGRARDKQEIRGYLITVYEALGKNAKAQALREGDG